MQDNYKTIERKLRNLEGFKGNSLEGFWDDRGYNIVSYRTLIATFTPNDKVAWVNPTKYSVTTSRHQNLIRKAWSLY
jgi:hypothetical protein